MYAKRGGKRGNRGGRIGVVRARLAVIRKKQCVRRAAPLAHYIANAALLFAPTQRMFLMRQCHAESAQI